MVFAETERLLVEHLKEAGERLVHPPSNVGELLSLLDRVECCLSWISKPLPKSIKHALHLKTALVADDLMRHSDIDVRVAVASCISQITRISAPVTPYDDDEQMKKVFRLIVDAFEGLSDSSSLSYSKRVSILASMAVVRSCLVMMNLGGCDAMILEMFQHFLFSIRDSHPEHVFSDMETIMTLVLKESDDVSAELLSLLIDSLQKDVLPIRRKLAEKVIINCVGKLKPATIHRETVFAAKCKEANANASGEHPAIESKSLEKPVADTIPQEEAKEDSLKATGSGLLDLALGSSSPSQSVVTDDDSLTYPSSRNTDDAKTTDTVEKIEPDNLESKMAVKRETEPSQAIKRKRDAHYPPERSFDRSDSRELDYALKCLEAESRFAVIKEWERREKKKAAHGAVKKLYAIESWGKSKKAALEAQPERIEEQQWEREKAEFVKKMKNDVALLHKELKEAEEKPAMIEAKCGEEILKAEEVAGKHRASGTTTPTTPMTPSVLRVCLLFVEALGICSVLYLFVFGAR